MPGKLVCLDSVQILSMSMRQWSRKICQCTTDFFEYVTRDLQDQCLKSWSGFFAIDFQFMYFIRFGGKNKNLAWDLVKPLQAEIFCGDFMHTVVKKLFYAGIFCVCYRRLLFKKKSNDHYWQKIMFLVKYIILMDLVFIYCALGEKRKKLCSLFCSILAKHAVFVVVCTP